MKKILLLFLLAACAQAQSVKNTSYVTQSGEKVLRLEVTLPVDKTEAWKLFTNDDRLKKWIAPVAHIELKSGGYILTNYDATKPLTDPSSIRCDIINYIENEMITLKVNLNDNFPKAIQAEDDHLQEIIQLIPIGKKQTKIVSSMIGWGNGTDWEKTYQFFVKGNIYTYEELKKLYR